MRASIFLVIVFLPSVLISQIKPDHHKSLNAYVEYANQSADEITIVIKSIIDYYKNIEGKHREGAQYVCPFGLDPYYYNNVISLSKSLSPSIGVSIHSAFQVLNAAEKKIDEKCKALDTYHKLEDYKQDNFGKARLLIADIQKLITDYQIQQQALMLALETAYAESGGTSQQAIYRQADIMMHTVMASERNLLNEWKFNLKEDTHTGWSIEKLQQSISENGKQLTLLKNSNITAVKYPASSMWSQFQSSLLSILDVKRSGLDQYNFESKKSDKHSNDVYLELINYFNGTLVSEYNMFIEYAKGDGYYGLKTIKYVPAIEIRSQTRAAEIVEVPFKDIPRTALKISEEKQPISQFAHESLSNYVEFINESARQVNYLQSVLSNFNSSAVYFKSLESYERRAPMHFDFSDYHLPLSFYQKTISESAALPTGYSKSLNDQTTVLLDILKEMDNLSASLGVQVEDRKYESDRLDEVFKILERQEKLFKIWDEKKEILYGDLRSIDNSFRAADKLNSWQKSGKALLELTDLCRDALFKAKAYYSGDTTLTVSTEKIDVTIREVIAKEYDNMKGIQKIGRNNGLCPYTPYEDLPQTAKQLSEHFRKLQPPKNKASRFNHPYHSMVYLYNEIVDDYNKFCELSATVLHLKTVKQPELFFVKHTDSVVDNKPSGSSNQTHQNKTNRNATSEAKGPNPNTNTTQVYRDTVYIEKHDTVYLNSPSENLRSMEGYASNNMVLLLDVSGSMNQADKLPLLKKSMLDMLEMMRAEDKISIIVFSEKPNVLLKSVSFKEEDKIQNAIKELTPSGKTDGNAGLKLAYKVADEHYIRGGNNRIILATDGEFKVNTEIQQLIEKFAAEDIFLSVFNFGKGMGASKSLETLAGRGKGNYELISKENLELKLIREAKAKHKK